MSQTVTVNLFDGHVDILSKLEEHYKASRPDKCSKSDIIRDAVTLLGYKVSNGDDIVDQELDESLAQSVVKAIRNHGQY